jgi:hypothetical protein
VEVRQQSIPLSVRVALVVSCPDTTSYGKKNRLKGLCVCLWVEGVGRAYR